MKTPFLWAGSKDRTYKSIQHLIPEFGNYVEPFVGGGAVYFRLLAARGIFDAQLCDINDDLLVTYEVMRDQPNALCEALPAEKSKETFKLLMASAPFLTTKLDRASRFLYLNRNRFFGLGGWMVADRYARSEVIKRIQFFSPLMQRTKFYHGCMAATINNHSFVFSDPPYPGTNNTACYHIMDDDVLSLNFDYLKQLLDMPCSFFWITKFHPMIAALAQSYDVRVEKSPWTYRKPQQAVQKDYEIYIYRDNTQPLIVMPRIIQPEELDGQQQSKNL